MHLVGKIPHVRSLEIWQILFLERLGMTFQHIGGIWTFQLRGFGEICFQVLYGSWPTVLIGVQPPQNLKNPLFFSDYLSPSTDSTEKVRFSGAKSL